MRAEPTLNWSLPNFSVIGILLEDEVMGAFDKQKKEIKRDLKKQKTDLAKAKKLAETLFHQLEGVEGRLNQIEQYVDDMPGSEIDTAFKLICDKKDSPHIKDQLQQLAQRVIATTPARQTLVRKSTVTIRCGPARRATKISKGVVVKVGKKASTKVASKKTTASTSKASAKSGVSKTGSTRKPLSIGQATISSGSNATSVMDEDEDESNSNESLDDMEEC